jgi:pyridoxine kinase
MARVLCISSHTVFGPVGNAAAVPALQQLGHDVMALPTIVLSNHPGHGTPAGLTPPADMLTAMLERLRGIGALDQLDGILTGYFSNAAQVVAVAEQIAELKAKHEGLHVLVDPVLGDNGRLYVAEAVAQALRDSLLPLATISTPNLFEAQWLCGDAATPPDVTRLDVAEVILTSLPGDNDTLVTRLHGPGGQPLAQHATARRHAVPHGTGDFLAGCYLAHRLAQTPVEAFAKTMSRLDHAITRSAGKVALDVSA